PRISARLVGGCSRPGRVSGDARNKAEVAGRATVCAALSNTLVYLQTLLANHYAPAMVEASVDARAGAIDRPAGPRWWPRLAWNVDELSGAVGDLGTFLPHVLGAIAVVGMAPSGVLTSFGLFYLASGWLYGIPIGVQPMKAASAAVLIQ